MEHPHRSPLHLVGEPRPLPPMSGMQLMRETADVVAEYISARLDRVPVDDPARGTPEILAAGPPRLYGEVD